MNISVVPKYTEIRIGGQYSKLEDLFRQSGGKRMFRVLFIELES